MKLLLSRCVTRLLDGMQSPHSKIACQCIVAIENPLVLMKYFVDDTAEGETPRDEDGVPLVIGGGNGGTSSSDGSINSSLPADVTRSTVDVAASTAASTATSTATSAAAVAAAVAAKEQAVADDVRQFQQEQLERLVAAVRRNRGHWHPLVQAASSRLFDLLLNHLV
jgi:hypothetical protein